MQDETGIMTRVQDSNGLDLTWLGLPRFGRDESQSVNKVFLWSE